MKKLILLSILAASVGVAEANDEEQLAKGKAVYDKWCLICHGEDNGSSGGGTRALKFLYKGVLPAKLEDRTDMTPEFIKTLVRKGQAGMPNFRYTEISPEDLEAIIAYLTRNNKQ